MDNECTAALIAFKKSQLEGTPITRKITHDELQEEEEDKKKKAKENNVNDDDGSKGKKGDDDGNGDVTDQLESTE